MRVKVDKELCTGHARCAAMGPGFYAVDDEGFNTLIDAGEVEVPAGLEEDARAGCEACPEQAIALLRGDG